MLPKVWGPTKSGALGFSLFSLMVNPRLFVCNLHLNELSLRHLCKHLIGPTESSTNWKRPVGNALATCESLPLSSTGIRCIPDGPPLADIDLADLSRGQTYLYKIIKAVKTGLISSDLLREKPGPMSHARWLTTAGRICRLYIATVTTSMHWHFLLSVTMGQCGLRWRSVPGAQMVQYICCKW